MPTPLNKGIRDFSRDPIYTVVTYTKTNSTTTHETKCLTTFSDKFSSEYSSYYDCTKTTTSTIPTFTATTIDTTTGREPTCETCVSTIRTYPPTTAVNTFTETSPKWRPIENKKSYLVEQAIPWHPLGVCGLAKWYMADKGHPAWGVKRKIHIYDDDDSEEYQGALEQTGLLEAGIETEAYKGYFSEGKLSADITAISNKVKIYQGLEGFVRGAFLWRYNYHNPHDKGYTPLFTEIQTKWTQSLGGVIYPTDWIRIRVQGVKLNEDGEITEIAVVTKYGTGANPVYAIRENTFDGSFWTNSASVLRSPACTLGYEGHVAIIPIGRLFEFEDQPIFHFIDDDTKNDIDYTRIASVDIPSNVANDWSYPLTLDENQLTEAQFQAKEYASEEKQDGVNNLIEELDRSPLQPTESNYNLEAKKEEIKEELLEVKKKDLILPISTLEDPVGNANTPTDSSLRFKFWEYYPNIWKLNTNTPEFSESNYPYFKSWNIGSEEVTPQFRITWFRRYPQNQDSLLGGVDYIRKAIDPNNEILYTWTAWKEYTWLFQKFGTQDLKWVLGHPQIEFLHDFQTANIQTIRTNKWWEDGWSTQNSFTEEETLNSRLDFYFKPHNEELITENIGAVFPAGHKMNLKANLRDQAIMPYWVNNAGGDAIFLFEFPPYNRE